LTLFVAANIKSFQCLIDEISIDLTMDEKCSEEYNQDCIHLFKIPSIDLSPFIEFLELECTNQFTTKILLDLFSGLDLIDPPDNK
jgi:hypothetical protein